MGQVDEIADLVVVKPAKDRFHEQRAKKGIGARGRSLAICMGLLVGLLPDFPQRYQLAFRGDLLKGPNSISQ